MILLKPIVPVFQYIINYDYIATELCVNKETPIMACNGKCYLMKELANASESEKPLSSDKKHTIIETTDLFVNPISEFNTLTFQCQNSTVTTTFYSNLYKQNLLFPVFHPPAILS